MRFKIFLLLSAIILNCNAKNTDSKRPKLVVGIVVDQMRYDYLTRFENRYGEGGFKRLMNKGFNCKNNHYNYVPTYTGPGHASVYTGTTPKHHGIISNSWYDKEINSYVYCAGDDSVNSVGTSKTDGKMSPHRMISSTFPDENRIFTQMRGKTIGISVKDRGAILPAGHTANAAYWFQGKNEGKFITSTYYMENLPAWVERFNSSSTVKDYLKEWNTLYDISTYTQSGPDLNDFEDGFEGKETATFPYDIKSLSLKNGVYDMLKSTPYGNNIVTDFAIAALDGEALGQDDFTDVLAISYSSTDYIGHNFGPNSVEVEDTYLRLDKDIERLLNTLDNKVGRDQYVVFLTSDHGVVNVPAYLKSLKLPAGYIDSDTAKQEFEAFLLSEFGSADIVENVSNNQVFLNREKIKELNLELDDVQEAIVNEIIAYKNVDRAYSATTMRTTDFTTGIESLLQNGFHQKRSGDVIVVHEPNYLSSSHRTGTSHGSAYNYDTHVPLIFYGKGIKHGSTLKKTEIADIAPTISALLGISFPNAATGAVLDFVIED